MKAKTTTVLLGIGAVMAMVQLPRGAIAQPGGDGDVDVDVDGGPPDSGGGPPDSGGGALEVDSADLVECPEDGSNAHYDELLE